MELRLWAAYGESLAMTFAPNRPRSRGESRRQWISLLTSTTWTCRLAPSTMKWSGEFMSAHHGDALISAREALPQSRGAAATPRS